MKKLLALSLSVIMGMLAVIPTYASDNNLPLHTINIINEFMTQNALDSQEKKVLYDDINIINEYFFNKDYLTNITLSDNEYIYTYTMQLDSENIIVSDIQVEVKKNGDIGFLVKEGNKENKLLFTQKDQVFIDGYEIKIEEIQSDTKSMQTDKKVSDNMQPYALGSVYYSAEPFWGSEKDYSKYNGEQQFNVITDYLIQSATVAALTAIIGYALPQVGVVLSIALIAQTLIDAYKAYNLKGKTLFYSMATWDPPNAPPITDTLTSYYKYRIRWFTDSNYSVEIKELREEGYNKTVIRDV